MECKGHIMLSYQWDSQKAVCRICEELRSSGFNVWMDLDSMSGDIFNKMAEGVEGAAIIIVCMSMKYQSSENCNKEFKYAQVKRKKIIPIKMEKGFVADGALGLITAGKLYIDFSDTSTFNENMKSLEKEIRAMLGETKVLPDLVSTNPSDIGITTKMFSISVGSASGQACRIGKGMAREALQFQPDFVFYASETEVDGMAPFSVGFAGEGDRWRHNIVQGPDAGKRGWTHAFRFFAFPSKRHYTTPYAVGHTDNEGGGWKYCVKENVTSATDHEWPDNFCLDFVFHSFSDDPECLVPIFVASFNDNNIANVSVTPGCDNRTEFAATFSFQALSYAPLDCFPFSVDENEAIRNGNDPRYRIRQETFTEVVGYADGWKKQQHLLFGFERMKSGLIPISLGYRSYPGGRQYCIAHNSHTVLSGWTQQSTFFVYPFDASLGVSVAVGFESEHDCCRLKQASRLEEAYFKHGFTFCGYSYQHPGTVPISVGQAGAEYNHTLRSRVELGRNAGNRGWKHCFTVFVFKEEKPGTFPVSVSHSDFRLGGWKYRVSKESASSETPGWTHDFVFYAYPLPN